MTWAEALAKASAELAKSAGKVTWGMVKAAAKAIMKASGG